MAPADRDALSAAELLDHLNGLLERAQIEDQRAALRTALAAGLRSRTATGADLVRILADSEVALGRDLNRQQQVHLGATLGQLEELAQQPETVRAGNQRHRQWQTSQHLIGDDRGLTADVATGMAGTVTAATQRPRGATVRYRDGLATDSGHHNFGDGADTTGMPTTDVRSTFAQAGPGMYEGVAFTPVTEPSYRPETQRTGALWWKKTDTRQVRDGNRPQLVAGPNGPEPAVHVSYAFDPHQLGQRRRPDLPIYPSSQPNQPGNFLTVQATLPASVAARLQEAIRQDPAAARDFAEQALRVNCGVDERTWTGVDGAPPMRPPWDGVPPSEPIHLVTTGRDGRAEVEQLFIAEPSAPSYQPDSRLADQVRAFTSQGTSGQERPAGAAPPVDSAARSVTHGRTARPDQENTRS